jgi:nitrate/nitrite-specific signal transduction histidine kinase
MTILPAVAFGAVSTIVGYRSGRQQVIDQLESVATIKEEELSIWAQAVQTDVAMAAMAPDATRYMAEVLSPAEIPDERQTAAYDMLHDWFGHVVAESSRLDELLLMDLDTRVVLSTQQENEGRLGGPGAQVYFLRGLEREYLSPPSYATLVGEVALMAVRPVVGEQGHSMGLLAGRAGPTGLSEIMLERTGLGDTGETYLVMSTHVMLTQPRFPREKWSDLEYVFTDGAFAALGDQRNGSGTYSNYEGRPVIGVYHWLPDLQLALIAEQWEAEAMSAVYANLLANLGVTVVAVSLAGTVSLLLARSIVLPLGDLARTAKSVAEGQFDHNARETGPDEIGAVAKAFNTMAARLRALIRTLEERVKERTEDLERRALQLETSARVSREIASILDIDALLGQVADLIKESFGHYYVCVYLLDEERGELVLGAHSGTMGGSPYKESSRLPVDEMSLNAEVVRANRALMTNDVSLDPRYRSNESVPDTRSELVVPLRIGSQAIGTLDVHSARENAFGEEDVGVMQSLADQVAVAVENARLYEHSQSLAVLEERQRFARELHDSLTQSLYGISLFSEAARREMRSGDAQAVQAHLEQLATTGQQALKQMRLLVFELRPPALEREGLAAVLRERLRMVEGRLGIETHFGVDDQVGLSPQVEEALYRIAEEALNNALRHAAATSVVVYLGSNANCVRLEVTDNGRGFDPQAVHGRGGVGLLTMCERAEALGGELNILSSPGQGTTVRVQLEVGP